MKISEPRLHHLIINHRHSHHPVVLPTWLDQGEWRVSRQNCYSIAVSFASPIKMWWNQSLALVKQVISHYLISVLKYEIIWHWRCIKCCLCGTLIRFPNNSGKSSIHRPGDQQAVHWAISYWNREHRPAPKIVIVNLPMSPIILFYFSGWMVNLFILCT